MIPQILFPDQPDDQQLDDADKQVLGMTIGVFVVVLVINVILFFIAIYILVENWKNLPNWAQVAAVICLFIGMPLITIIIVLVAKK